MHYDKEQVVDEHGKRDILTENEMHAHLQFINISCSPEF